MANDTHSYFVQGKENNMINNLSRKWNYNLELQQWNYKNGITNYLL